MASGAVATSPFGSQTRCAKRGPPKNGRRGGQPRYSNLAIMTALTLRVVFHLPLRQTEGFLDSLLRLMELDLKAPDHTTLSRRNKNVDVPPPTWVPDGALHLIVDSTGLKISGAGEWHAHRHKSSRRVDNGGSYMSAWVTTASSWRRRSRRAARTIRPLSRSSSNRSTLRSDVSQPMGLRYSVGVRAAR